MRVCVCVFVSAVSSDQPYFVDIILHRRDGLEAGYVSLSSAHTRTHTHTHIYIYTHIHHRGLVQREMGASHTHVPGHGCIAVDEFVWGTRSTNATYANDMRVGHYAACHGSTCIRVVATPVAACVHVCVCVCVCVRRHGPAASIPSLSNHSDHCSVWHGAVVHICAKVRRVHTPIHRGFTHACSKVSKPTVCALHT